MRQKIATLGLRIAFRKFNGKDYFLLNIFQLLLQFQRKKIIIHLSLIHFLRIA